MASLRSANDVPASARTRARPPLKRTECLAGRTLAAVARQREGLDAARCQVVFEHLDTSHAVQLALQRALGQFGVTELQFGVLVALFALDPEPGAPADLAEYTGVSRAAITDAVVRLESLKLLSRRRDPADRRVFHLRLTAAGRTTIDQALVAYLRAVGNTARHLEASAYPTLLNSYARLQQGAAELAS